MPAARTPLPPLEPADLPDKKLSFWQLAGPGAILAGLAIGAGEIMLWPYLIDRFGPSITWAAMIGVFLQFWINLEISRYTIATGETAYTGLARLHRGFGPLFILFNVLGWIAPAWAMASGLALKALLVGPQGWGNGSAWTAITFALVALLLFGPKAVYTGVEKGVSALVAIITVGLVVVAVVVGTGRDWAEVGAGLLSFGRVPEGLDTKTLFIAITAAGAAGTANLFYGFYLRDKHIGMGARLPELPNPLRGRMEKAPTTGYVFPDTPENGSRFRAWFRHVAGDQALFFWGLNSFTLLLFIFAATAVLRDTPGVLKQTEVINAEAVALGAALPGAAGAGLRVLFLLVGFATLFSTQIALVDGVARSISDILYVQFPRTREHRPEATAAAEAVYQFPRTRERRLTVDEERAPEMQFPRTRARSLPWWYLVIAVTWMIASTALAAFLESRGITEMGYLFNAAYVGGICMAVYVPALLWINHRFLPPSARPNLLCTVMTGLAGLFYVGFSIASILWEFGPR
jgi:MFS family permease